MCGRVLACTRSDAEAEAHTAKADLGQMEFKAYFGHSQTDKSPAM